MSSKKNSKKKQLLEPWIITIICIGILICFVVVGYSFFLFFQNDQKLPHKLMSKESVWKKLGLGPALGLVQKPKISQVRNFK